MLITLEAEERFDAEADLHRHLPCKGHVDVAVPGQPPT